MARHVIACLVPVPALRAADLTHSSIKSAPGGARNTFQAYLGHVQRDSFPRPVACRKEAPSPRGLWMPRPPEDVAGKESGSGATLP